MMYHHVAVPTGAARSTRVSRRRARSRRIARAASRARRRGGTLSPRASRSSGVPRRAANRRAFEWRAADRPRQPRHFFARAAQRPGAGAAVPSAVRRIEEAAARPEELCFSPSARTTPRTARPQHPAVADVSLSRGDRERARAPERARRSAPARGTRRARPREGSNLSLAERPLLPLTASITGGRRSNESRPRERCRRSRPRATTMTHRTRRRTRPTSRRRRTATASPRWRLRARQSPAEGAASPLSPPRFDSGP